ncbi:MAG: hypothetical protein PWQ57_1102 [Desulfovibrionales bacterium]|jgi:hypothetical protein|nr:hypothetical protein [Desulfovibrionales bacterium]
MIYAMTGSLILIFFTLYVMRKISAWELERLATIRRREAELQVSLSVEIRTKRVLSLKLHELHNRLKLMEYQVYEMDPLR